MNIIEYNKLQKRENYEQLAIDFDGVIHPNSKGFHDGTVYDPPTAETINALRSLSRRYTIVIFTAKAKTDRPLINGKTGAELIWEWLERYDLTQYIHQVTAEKPRATAYIDDKGIRFKSWSDILKMF